MVVTGPVPARAEFLTGCGLNDQAAARPGKLVTSELQLLTELSAK